MAVDDPVGDTVTDGEPEDPIAELMAAGLWETPAEWRRRAKVFGLMPYPLGCGVATETGRWASEQGPLDAAVEATRAALRFLEAGGLRPLGDVGRMGLSREGVLLTWADERLAVLALIESRGSLGVALLRPQRPPTTAEALLDRLPTPPGELLTFGQLWLTGDDRPALDREIGDHLAVLQDALGPDPQHVRFDDIRPVLAAHERRFAAEREVPFLRREADAAWGAGRLADYLQVVQWLDHHGAESDPARRAAALEDLAEVLPASAWPITVAGVHHAADLLNDAHARLRSAPGDPRDHAALFHLVSARLYTPELSDAVERLRQGDPAAVEPALIFLEADPWAFRTGYQKQVILRRLRRCPLDPGQQERLRAVLLRSIDAGPRREHTDACRLAYRVADDAFLAALRSRLDGPPGIAERARSMLDAIRLPAGEQAREYPATPGHRGC